MPCRYHLARRPRRAPAHPSRSCDDTSCRGERGSLKRDLPPSSADMPAAAVLEHPYVTSHPSGGSPSPDRVEVANGSGGPPSSRITCRQESVVSGWAGSRVPGSAASSSGRRWRGSRGPWRIGRPGPAGPRRDGVRGWLGASPPAAAVAASSSPTGWNGCSISRTDLPSHMSAAWTRCLSVSENDHSPSTETSTVPSGIAATRSSVAAHVLERPRRRADRPIPGPLLGAAGKRRFSSASTKGTTSTPLTSGSCR